MITADARRAMAGRDSITFDSVPDLLRWMDASKLFKGRRVEVLWDHARGCAGGGRCDQSRGCRPILVY